MKKSEKHFNCRVPNPYYDHAGNSLCKQNFTFHALQWWCIFFLQTRSLQ